MPEEGGRWCGGGTTLQVTAGWEMEKAGGRRRIRYERCRIAWEWKKRKLMLMFSPSCSEPSQPVDCPITRERSVLITVQNKMQKVQGIKMCFELFYTDYTLI